ncbi:MAG: hypothetical protein ACRD5E_14135 [Nitrososphaeraceae archaeon]
MLDSEFLAATVAGATIARIATIVTPVGLCKGCANLSKDYVSEKSNKKVFRKFPNVF